METNAKRLLPKLNEVEAEETLLIHRQLAYNWSTTRQATSDCRNQQPEHNRNEVSAVSNRCATSHLTRHLDNGTADLTSYDSTHAKYDKIW